MDRWRRIVDHLLADVIGDGDVSHLPQAGKPLKLEAEAHTPDDLRAAFKIMQDHQVLPDWLTEGKSLEAAEARLRAEIAAQADLFNHQPHTRVSALSDALARKRWSAYLEDFSERVDRHNRKALTYNLKVPRGIPHKKMLNSDSLVESALQKAIDETNT